MRSGLNPQTASERSSKVTRFFSSTWNVFNSRDPFYRSWSNLGRIYSILSLNTYLSGSPRSCDSGLSGSMSIPCPPVIPFPLLAHPEPPTKMPKLEFQARKRVDFSDITSLTSWNIENMCLVFNFSLLEYQFLFIFIKSLQWETFMCDCSTYFSLCSSIDNSRTKMKELYL